MDSPFPARCLARFEPIRQLDKGCFGSVWIATQRTLEREVVVKFLHPQVLEEPGAARRFRDEAQVTARLSHPHIVILVDHDVEEGVPWIAYEYLAGRSLGALLRSGTLDWRSAFEVANQMSDALAEAHAHGVVHRDVKPDNILAARPGWYKLADFGVARWAGEHTVQTADGVFVGTPTYAAPESLRGVPATPRSDIFALGLVLHEMLTGRKPFPQGNLVDIIQHRIQNDVLPPSRVLPALPEFVDEVVLKAVASCPDDRYESAGEFQAAIGRTLRRSDRPPARRTSRKQAITAVPAAPDRTSGATVVLTPDAGRPTRRVGWAVLGLAALVVSVWSIHSARRPDPRLLARSPSPPSPVVTAPASPSADPVARAAALIHETAGRLRRCRPGDLPRLGAVLEPALSAFRSLPRGSRDELWASDDSRSGLAAAIHASLTLAGPDPARLDPVLRPFFAAESACDAPHPFLLATLGRWVASHGRAAPSGRAGAPALVGSLISALALLSSLESADPRITRAWPEIVLLCAPVRPSTPVSPATVKERVRSLLCLLHLHEASQLTNARSPKGALAGVARQIDEQLLQLHRILKPERPPSPAAGPPALAWSRIVVTAKGILQADVRAALDRIEAWGRPTPGPWSPTVPVAALSWLRELRSRCDAGALDRGLFAVICRDLEDWLAKAAPWVGGGDAYWQMRAQLLHNLREYPAATAACLEGIEVAVHPVTGPAAPLPGASLEASDRWLEVTAEALSTARGEELPWVSADDLLDGCVWCLECAAVSLQAGRTFGATGSAGAGPRARPGREALFKVERAWLLARAGFLAGSSGPSLDRELGKSGHALVSRTLTALATRAVSAAKAAVDRAARAGEPVPDSVREHLSEAGNDLRVRR